MWNYCKSINLGNEINNHNHQTQTYVDYPYFVATNNIEKEYSDALEVLHKYSSRLRFPVDRYKWHASKAVISNDAVEAEKALEAAQVKRSGFRFHQNVGLVGNEHKETIKHLCKLCSK